MLERLIGTLHARETVLRLSLAFAGWGRAYERARDQSYEHRNYAYAEARSLGREPPADAMQAIRNAAGALVVRVLISSRDFHALFDDWASVIGPLPKL